MFGIYTKHGWPQVQMEIDQKHLNLTTNDGKELPIKLALAAKKLQIGQCILNVSRHRKLFIKKNHHLTDK